jgi:hypothetical protein
LKKETYYLLPTKIQLDQEELLGELSLPLNKKKNPRDQNTLIYSENIKRKSNLNSPDSAMTFLNY